MNRQQRSNYIRQRLPTVSSEALYGLLWTIDSSIGAVLTLRITGMLQGMVASGFPPLVALNSGRVAVSAVFAEGPDPTNYNLLAVTFDGPLDEADLYTLEAPSQCLRNRWGGVLSAGKQAFPTPFIFSDEIAMSYASHGGSQVIVSFLSQFLPVCIGPTSILQNDDNMELGNFTGWLGNDAMFDFASALVTGMVISWPGNQPAFKNQFGGDLIAGSFVIP